MTECHSENISFRLIPILNISHRISSVFISDTKLVVGTYEGEVLIFKLIRNFQDYKELISAELTHQLKIGNKPIDNVVCLFSHQEDINHYLIVLSDGTVMLYKLKELNSPPVILDNQKEVNSICICDDSQIYGLCINVKRRLYLYNLLHKVEKWKEFQIPEIPCRMSWWKNCLCLGFSTEYSLLDVSTGSVIELQTLKEPPSPAFLKGLPHDQLIVTTQKNVKFIDLKGKEQHPPLTLSETPLSLAVSYPFLFCLSRSFLEVKNMTNGVYHEILRKPNPNIDLLFDDGRTVLLADTNRIYMAQSQSLIYQVGDWGLFCKLCALNCTDKVAFVRFLNSLLSDSKNPFGLYFAQLVFNFEKHFKGITYSDTTFERAKKRIFVSLRRLFKILLFFFKEFVIQKELLYSTLQTVYFRRIYDIIWSIIHSKYEKEDNEYNQNIEAIFKQQQQQPLTPRDFEVDIKFWLTEESLHAVLSRSEKDMEDKSGIKENSMVYPIPPKGAEFILSSSEINSFTENDILAATQMSGSLSPQYGSRSYISVNQRLSSNIDPFLLSLKNVGDLIPKNEPYSKPIQTIQRIVKMKSPRGKLEVIFQSLQETMKCVKEFWQQCNREIVLGADDLVPLFCYIVARARIPNLWSELQFASEFSSQSVLKGKYGYCLATLEIVTQVLKTFQRNNNTNR